MSENHAIVFGASGVNGWAVVNALLQGYPSEDAFASVTALTNRPVSLQDTLWPKSPKLDLVSGIDLLADAKLETLEDELKRKVANADKITHVYFFAYIMDADPKAEVRKNTELVKRSVLAIQNVSSHFKFVVLGTGAKSYGSHLLEQFPFRDQVPLKESLPRMPEPFASQIFYYHQVDQLSWISQGKSWSFCELMPDLVVGFVPNNNYYCMAQILATYLALYAKINGKGSEVVFPGTQRSWECLSQDSSQDVIAKTAIYASLHPQETAGQRYNVTDSARPASWSEKWPVICEYFGLRGTGPRDGVAGPVPNEYLVEHYNEWRELEKEEGLKTGRVGNNKSYGDFARVMMTLCDLDRQLDMSKTHAMMGSAKVETDSRGAWWTAFDRFRRAKIIP
ncbi:short chain dehydrogenase sirQ like protein [Aspergillus niger]|uniref:SDR family oxidoreductase n=1 Tax=Aspergillus lacticoffeatus (strain CBS 101883) TaxID=1450533 RepID=UPI000D802782